MAPNVQGERRAAIVRHCSSEEEGPNRRVRSTARLGASSHELSQSAAIGNLNNDRSAFLRRDKDHRIRNRYDVVLLTRARE